MEAYWVPTVNNLKTAGRWAFAELTEIYQIESDFEAKVASAFDEMIERVGGDAARDFHLTAPSNANGVKSTMPARSRLSGLHWPTDRWLDRREQKIIARAGVADPRGPQVAPNPGVYSRGSTRSRYGHRFPYHSRCSEPCRGAGSAR